MACGEPGRHSRASGISFRRSLLTKVYTLQAARSSVCLSLANPRVLGYLRLGFYGTGSANGSGADTAICH